MKYISHISQGFILFLALILNINGTLAQISSSAVLSDLDQLSNLIKSEHVDAFRSISMAEFDTTVSNSKKLISAQETCDGACYAEVFKVVASIRDGQTTISDDSRYDLFGYLPISFRWFEMEFSEDKAVRGNKGSIKDRKAKKALKGEFRVVKTTKANNQVLGYKLTKVGGKKIDGVLKVLKSVVPHTNESGLSSSFGKYLQSPGLLHAVGITNNSNEVTFTFSNGSKSLDLKFKSIPSDKIGKLKFVTYQDEFHLPGMFQLNNDLAYWFDFDETNDLLYLQYNFMGDMEGEPFQQFSDDLWSLYDSREIKKLVLDLRYNQGGHFSTGMPLLQGILDRPGFNSRGRLYILTGQETSGAAMLMTHQLELRTAALIVGDTPGDRPGTTGETTQYVLKNSGLKVNLRTNYINTLSPLDQRNEHAVDVKILTSWDDYAEGVDSVLSFVINHNIVSNKATKASSVQPYLGTYALSPTRNIELKNIDGLAYLEVPLTLRSPLYKNRKGAYRLAVGQSYLSFNKDYLEIKLPGNRNVLRCNKISDASISPVDYFQKDTFKEGEKAYLQIKAVDPNFHELSDYQMSFLARMVHAELSKNPNKDANAMARNILNLGIKLNAGDAPLCKKALKAFK